MALQKEFEVNNSGITADYLKVSQVAIDASGNNILVQVDMYKDAAARQAGKAPISHININLALDAITTNFVELVYEEIKKLEQLQGALDV